MYNDKPAALRSLQSAAATLSILISLGLLFFMFYPAIWNLVINYWMYVAAFISIYVIAFLVFSWIIFGHIDE